MSTSCQSTLNVCNVGVWALDSHIQPKSNINSLKEVGLLHTHFFGECSFYLTSLLDDLKRFETVFLADCCAPVVCVFLALLVMIIN